MTYAVSKKTGVDLTAATAKTLTTNDSVDSTAVSTATTVSDVSDIVEKCYAGDCGSYQYFLYGISQHVWADQDLRVNPQDPVSCQSG